jgi:hypothetical protein
MGASVRLIALALVLAWPTPASAADPTFTFTATDAASGTFSYGVLEAQANGDGTYTATGGYLVVISGPDVGTYDLFPNPNPPHPASSPSGAFIFDNVLYPGQDPTLDVFGLLFTGGGLEINIWGTGPGTYSYFSFNGSGFNLASNNAVFTLATTPGQMIPALESIVTALVNTGVVLPAQGNSLQAKLDAALSAVDRGNAKAAAGSLGAFINQVNAFIQSGRLTAAQGESLIDQATAAIDALGG